jgi:hypothetical protein
LSSESQGAMLDVGRALSWTRSALAYLPPHLPRAGAERGAVIFIGPEFGTGTVARPDLV